MQAVSGENESLINSYTAQSVVWSSSVYGSRPEPGRGAGNRAGLRPSLGDAAITAPLHCLGMRRDPQSKITFSLAQEDQGLIFACDGWVRPGQWGTVTHGRES